MTYTELKSNLKKSTEVMKAANKQKRADQKALSEFLSNYMDQLAAKGTLRREVSKYGKVSYCKNNLEFYVTGYSAEVLCCTKTSSGWTDQILSLKRAKSLFKKTGQAENFDVVNDILNGLN